MTTIAGAHAIITGGSEGIGLALARRLRQRDARVSLVSRDEAKLAAAAVRTGAGTLTAAADVRDAGALAAAFEHLVEQSGPCDILVTAAGYAHPDYFERLSLQVFRDEMDVNYFGTLHAVQAVAPSMRERGHGHISLVASSAALLGVFGYSAYCPTKFAVRGLGETLRGELKPDGVSVSIVYPPDTDTPGFARENLTKPEETKRVSSTIKPRRPEQVAGAIVRGIEKDRFVITADPLTALLARGIGVLAPIAHASEDRIVRTTRAESR